MRKKKKDREANPSRRQAKYQAKHTHTHKPTITQRPTPITIRSHKPTTQRPTPMSITIGNHKPTTKPTPIGDSKIEQRGESEQKGKKKTDKGDFIDQ